MSCYQSPMVALEIGVTNILVNIYNIYTYCFLISVLHPMLNIWVTGGLVSGDMWEPHNTGSHPILVAFSGLMMLSWIFWELILSFSFNSHCFHWRLMEQLWSHCNCGVVTSKGTKPPWQLASLSLDPSCCPFTHTGAFVFREALESGLPMASPSTQFLWNQQWNGVAYYLRP